MSYPDLFIIGAPKCATTSLYDLLLAHPSVCKGRAKEPQFFNHFYERGESHYQKMFPMSCKKGDTFVDASPDYLHSRETPKNMLDAYGKERLKSKRLLAILRNPIDREFSWYNHLVKNCAPRLRSYMKHRNVSELRGGAEIWRACRKSRHCKSICFDDDESTRVLPKGNLLRGLMPFDHYIQVSPLHRSYYAESLRRYLQVFERNQIMVLSFDTLVKNTSSSINAITSFFGLSPIADARLPKANGASNDRKLQTTLQCETVLRMNKDGIGEKNEDLYNLLAVGERPAQEPAFPPFVPPRCED